MTVCDGVSKKTSFEDALDLTGKLYTYFDFFNSINNSVNVMSINPYSC